MTVLVTGATGIVGKEVVKQLMAMGQRVRASSTNPERARARLAAEGVTPQELCTLEFGAPDTYPEAFEGIKKVFLIRPPQITNIAYDMVPALEVAIEQGVTHIVFLSLQGAEKNPFAPHSKVEDYLKTSGLEYTFLRPSFFMQNLSGVHAADIRERGEIYVPAGQGRTSFIDVRDIAAVAAKVLSETQHAGKAYELTGAAALTYEEVANIFSDVLRTDIHYPNPNPIAFYRRMRLRGLEPKFVLVMIALYTACRFGLAANTTTDTAELLGRDPISVAQFVEDYKAAFLPAQSQ